MANPSEMPGAVPVGPLALAAYQDGAVVSRTLLKRTGGTVTLFAFDKGQALSEHTAPFDAIAHVLEGEALDHHRRHADHGPRRRDDPDAGQPAARGQCGVAVQDAADDASIGVGLHFRLPERTTASVKLPPAGSFHPSRLVRPNSSKVRSKTMNANPIAGTA